MRRRSTQMLFGRVRRRCQDFQASGKVISMRFMSILVGVNSLVLMMLFACAQAPDSAPDAASQLEMDLKAEERAIQAVLDGNLVAFNAGDLEGFLSGLTEDAVAAPPNSPALVGKDTLRSVYKQFFEESDLDCSIQVEELVIADQWAYERSVWTCTSTTKETGGSVHMENENFSIYERQPDGSWKLARFIWNSNIPLTSQ